MAWGEGSTALTWEQVPRRVLIDRWDSEVACGRPGDMGCVSFSHRDAWFPMGHEGETSIWYEFGWASGWGRGAAQQKEAGGGHSLPLAEEGAPRTGSVQSLSQVRLFIIPRTAACQASLSMLFSSSPSAIRVVSAYLRLLIFLPAVLIPACASSSLAFHMIYSAYKLNKQGDRIQPWRTLFPIWNQSVVLCLVLTVASWPAYRFLRRQLRWSGILISLRIFHSLLWSTQSKALA